MKILLSILLFLFLCPSVYAQWTSTHSAQSVDLVPLNRGFYTSAATVTGSVSAIPLFSYGAGAIWRNPHNEYLRIFCEAGLIGLGLFLMFCFSVFWKFIRSKKTPLTITLMSSLVAFLISCMFMFPLEIPTTCFLGVIFVGFLINLLEKKEEIA